MKRGRGGTGTRSRMDVGRLAEAVKKSGIDPRYWCSYGTVGTEKDDGSVDFGDALAVHITPEGVDVDVCLEPLGIVVTCTYTGIQGGDKVSFFSPIEPGDRVLVNLPDGDTAGPPAIQAILHSANNPMPVGDDGKPIFQNDRVLLHSDGQDVDVRVVGADATFIADNVKIGGRDANEPLVLGTQYKTQQNTMMDAHVADVRPSPVGPIAPSAGLVSAANAFKASVDTQLSDNNFTKKANDGN